MRDWQRPVLKLWCVCWLAMLAWACNSLTGVDDLEFAEREPEANMSMNPLLPCNVVTGAGCAAGQTCRLSSEQGGPACLPAPAEPAAPYAVCALDGECPESFVCDGGVCAKVCAEASDCGWPNAQCVGRSGRAPGFGRCSRNCDLAAPANPRAGLQACGSGARCDFRADAASSGFTDCSPADGLSFDGGVCQVNADCPAALACEGGRCLRVCDDGANGCIDGLTCSGIEPFADQRVGTCCEVPAGQGCDLVTDCGCGSGETCGWSDDGLTIACRPLAATPVEPEAPCFLTADCPRRHSCIAGICSQHCNTALDCTIEGSACGSVGFVDGAAIEGRAVCSPPCDPVSPLAPDAGFLSCSSGTSCMLFADGLGGPNYFACGAAGAGVEGSTCTFNTECSLGLFCDGATCRRWCSPDENTCGDAFACGGVADVFGQILGACCSVPAGQACDWTTNCGCDADEACAQQNGVRSCRASSPNPVAPNAACLADVDCPVLHSCVSGNCMQHCTTAAECASPEAVCFPFGPAAPAFNGLCSTSCDVFSPETPAPGFEPCGAGLACSDFVADGVPGFFACVQSGPALEGEDCSLDFCAPGLTCLGGICVAYCELGTSCAEGDCQADPPVPVLAGRALGLCPLPAADGDDDED